MFPNLCWPRTAHVLTVTSTEIRALFGQVVKYKTSCKFSPALRQGLFTQKDNFQILGLICSQIIDLTSFSIPSVPHLHLKMRIIVVHWINLSLRFGQDVHLTPIKGPPKVPSQEDGIRVCWKFLF